MSLGYRKTESISMETTCVCVFYLKKGSAANIYELVDPQPGVELVLYRVLSVDPQRFGRYPR